MDLPEPQTLPFGGYAGRGEARRQHDPVTGRYVSKLTTEVQERVCNAIRSGSSLAAAAGYAGVAEASVTEWLRLGRTLSGEPKHEQFADAVDQAYAEWEVAAVGRLYQLGIEGDARSLMFLLERKLPGRWGRRERLEHANADGAPFDVRSLPMFDADKLTTEQLATLVALHELGRPSEPTVIEGRVRRRLDDDRSGYV